MTCSLLGYTQRADMHGPGNDGQLDPLFCRAVVFQFQKERYAWLFFDLCILEDPAAEELRRVAADVLNTSTDHVLVAASHTHSGPYPWSNDWSEGPREFTPDLVRESESCSYWQHLKQQVVKTVQDASEDLHPTCIRSRTSSLGFAYKRRIATDAGVQMVWNPKECPKESLSPADDTTLTTLEFHRDGSPILIYNLAGHPVVLGKESNQVSADWPGAVSRQVADRLPDLQTCFFHGAGADAHPWLATDNHPEDLEQVGRPVAGILELLYSSSGTTEEITAINVRSQMVQLQHRPLPLSAWRIGPIRVLAFPGEMFGSSGAWLRDQIPGPLMLATTSNGWTGYWPPARVYEEEGYEVNAVRSFGWDKGDTETMLEAARELLLSV